MNTKFLSLCTHPKRNDNIINHERPRATRPACDYFEARGADATQKLLLSVFEFPHFTLLYQRSEFVVLSMCRYMSFEYVVLMDASTKYINKCFTNLSNITSL